MTIRLLFVAFLFLNISCQSDRKIADESDSNPDKPAGKMTADDGKQNQLQLGVKVRLEGLSDIEGSKIAKSVQGQLQVFSECLQPGHKKELIQLTSKIVVSKKGRIEGIEVLSLTPENAEFRACFLKQIGQLDFGAQKRVLKGELKLVTFYGDPIDWEHLDRKRQ